MIDVVGEYHALMRRTPIAAAQQLHRQYGMPWKAILATVPAPARVRFADRARALFEPDEDGSAVLRRGSAPGASPRSHRITRQHRGEIRCRRRK